MLIFEDRNVYMIRGPERRIITNHTLILEKNILRVHAILGPESKPFSLTMPNIDNFTDYIEKLLHKLE